jgi:hypothetical protein
MFTNWTHARSSVNMHGRSRAPLQALALGAISVRGSGGWLPRVGAKVLNVLLKEVDRVSCVLNRFGGSKQGLLQMSVG